MCLSVVALHVICAETDNIPQSDWSPRLKIERILVETFFRLSVPVFITITGSLLLRKERELSWKKLKTKITHMLLVIITFGLAYCLIESYLNGARGLLLLTESILNLMQGKSWAVMWYVYMLIGLYAITPIIKAYTDKATQKEYRITLIVLFVISSLIPTINTLTGLHFTQFYLQGLLYIFYYMLGQYLFRYSIPTKHILILMPIGLIGSAILNTFDGIAYELDRLSSVFMVLLVISVYLLAKTANLKESKTVNFIAKYSFGIYLIHTFWLNVLNKGFGFYPSAMPVIIGEISVFIYAIIASILSCLVLYRLPIFKKILK